MQPVGSSCVSSVTGCGRNWLIPILPQLSTKGHMGLGHMWKCTLTVVSEQCWSRPVNEHTNQDTGISVCSLKTRCLAWELPWLPRGSWTHPSCSSGRDSFVPSKSVVRASTFTFPTLAMLAFSVDAEGKRELYGGEGDPWYSWPPGGLRMLTGWWTWSTTTRWDTGSLSRLGSLPWWSVPSAVYWEPTMCRHSTILDTYTWLLTHQ